MNNDDMHHAYVLKPFPLVFNNIFYFHSLIVAFSINISRYVWSWYEKKLFCDLLKLRSISLKTAHSILITNKIVLILVVYFFSQVRIVSKTSPPELIIEHLLLHKIYIGNGCCISVILGNIIPPVGDYTFHIAPKSTMAIEK